MNASRGVDIMERSKSEQKSAVKASDSIEGGNACTMCLYNIPRASLMIALPGLVILVCGAALTAFIDANSPWTDGLAMIALVSLVLGGVWTLGGLVYWCIAWLRLKPERRPIRTSAPGHDNLAVQLDAVTPHPCDTTPDKTVPSSTNSDKQTHSMKTSSSKHDTVPLSDDVVYTVT